MKMQSPEYTYDRKLFSSHDITVILWISIKDWKLKTQIIALRIRIRKNGLFERVDEIIRIFTKFNLNQQRFIREISREMFRSLKILDYEWWNWSSWIRT